MKTVTYPYAFSPVSEMMTPQMKELFANGRTDEDWGSPEERAARGAEVLDLAIPDWFTRVEIRQLDLKSRCDCVLGQLFQYDGLVPAKNLYMDGMRFDDDVEFIANGQRTYFGGFSGASTIFGYDIGQRLLVTDIESAVGTADTFLGFDRLLADDESQESEDYEALTSAWRAEIAKRVNATVNA